MKFTSGLHLTNDHKQTIKKSKKDEIAYLFLQWRRNIFVIFKAIEDSIRNKANQINYKRILPFGSKRKSKRNNLENYFNHYE